MSQSSIRQVSDSRLEVHGEMGFATAKSLLKASRKLISGKEQVIDLNAVTRADSAGLALMLEWERMAMAQGGRIRFAHVSDQLRAIAGTCGVDELLPEV